MSRGRGWPIAITAILAITVAANVWVMHIASADPSFAIEPDYYAKAVRWDSTMAQERRNLALGWQVSPSLAPFDAARGADLRVVVTGAAGEAITDADVRVAAFAIARSARIVDVRLAAKDGAYDALVPLRHGGAWELRFDIRRGPDHVVLTRRVEAVAAAAGTPRG